MNYAHGPATVAFDPTPVGRPGAGRQGHRARLPGARIEPEDPDADAAALRRDAGWCRPRSSPLPLLLVVDGRAAAVRGLGVVGVRASRRRSCGGAAGCSTRRRSRTRGTARLTMDTLVSIGTIAAWTWSVVALVFVDDGDMYFETAAVIITLILLGRTSKRERAAAARTRCARCSARREDRAARERRRDPDRRVSRRRPVRRAPG